MGQDSQALLQCFECVLSGSHTGENVVVMLMKIKVEHDFGLFEIRKSKFVVWPGWPVRELVSTFLYNSGGNNS